MRNAVIGLVIGLVLGVVTGATVIAPRLAPPAPGPHADATPEAGRDPLPPRPVAAPAPPSPAGPAVRWRLASAHGASVPQLGTLAKRLEREIWRVSAGDIEIRFHPPGGLVAPSEMFEAVASGAIDAAFSSPGLWADRMPALQLFAAVPFGPDAEETLAWFYFGGGKALYEELHHAHGLHGVACGLVAPGGAGWFRRPIQVVEDLRGLRMRFTGLGAKVLGRLGVQTRPLAGGDIFLAFEAGSIDAAAVSVPIVDWKLGLQRLAKHYYFPGWHRPATILGLMVERQRWESLTAVSKAQIESVCGDNVRHGLAEGEAAQFVALKALATEGVEFHRWPREIMEALETAWAEVAAEEVAADPDFARVWESLAAFRREHAIWRELSRR